MPENKRGLPNNFFTKYSSSYVEELATERILNKVREIDISKIERDLNQPRKNFDEEALKELANSIREKGVLEPILVRKAGDGYIIVAGERRWRASRLAGKTTVPAIVIEPKDEREIREIQIIENLQREDISPIERARAILDYLKPLANGKSVKTLLINMRMGREVPEEFALTVSALCRTIGKSEITLIRWLSLLELPEEIQDKVNNPHSPLTSKHVEQLLQLKDIEILKDVVKLIEKNNLSSEETKNLVRHLNRSRSAFDLSRVIKELEKLASKISFIDSGKELNRLKKDLLILKDLVEELLDKV